MKKFILNKVENNEYLNDLKGQPDFQALKFKDCLYYVENEEDFQNVKDWLNAKNLINDFFEDLKDFTHDGSISDYNTQQGLANERANTFLEIMADNFKFFDTIKLAKEIQNGKYEYLRK